MIAAGELLEHAEVFGRCYGTPRAAVETALAAGRDVLFDVDWQGHRLLRAALPGDVVDVGGTVCAPAVSASKSATDKAVPDAARLRKRDLAIPLPFFYCAHPIV